MNLQKPLQVDRFWRRYWSSIPNFIRSLAGYYAETEKTLTARLLQSPCIHADETQISIKKTHWYIWVFTDGKRVIFRLTET
jgi:hypothetical protein